MKNLKRILSLALAGTMLCGMMVVGASAANFTDADKIEHTEAVETMTALGVINGFTQPDGTVEFAPQDGLTRAQMATMIAIIANKGTVPTWAVKTTPTFADVAKGSWYEAAIEYCYNLGYINGYSATSFGPNDSLTATQAARMILNLLGYKATGTGDWQLETEVQARDEALNLYNGLDDVVTNQPINRDNVAQMLCSALYAPVAGAEVTSTTIYRLENVGDNTGVTAALAAMKFDTAADAKAVADAAGLEAGKYGIVRGTDSAVTETLGNKYLGMMTDEMVVTTVTYNSNNKAYTAAPYTTTIDLTQYIGQKVKVLYKNNANKTVYGVVPTGTVLHTGAYSDITKIDPKKKTVTVGGQTYGYNNADFTAWNTTNAAEPNDWDELTVITNSANGKIDMMIVKPVNVAKVTNVGKTSIVAGKTYTFKDNNIADGLKNGDWVTIIDTLESGSTIAKLEKTENVLATAKDKDNNYTIGGKIYYNANDGDLGLTLGTSYDLVAINGAVFEATEHTDGTTAAAGVDKLVYALRAGAAEVGKDDLGKPTGNATQNVELLFADGSKKIVTVDKVDGKKITPDADTTDDEAEETALVVEDTLYTYAYTEKTKTYQLTAAPAAEAKLGNLTGKDAEDANVADNMIGSMYVNDDAVLFVCLNKSDAENKEVKVLTGAEVAKWTLGGETNKAFDANSVLYTESKNGAFLYAAAGVLFIDSATATKWPGSVSSTMYGYLLADAVKVYSSTLKESFAQIQIWNGENNVTRLYTLGEGEDLEDFTAGMMVSYTEGDNDTLVTLADLGATADAVTAYAGGTAIRFQSSDKTSLKDAVIIFINDEEGKGVAATEASIQLAAEHAEVADLLINNVYVADDDGQMVLFVDSENAVNEQTKVFAVTYKIAEESTSTATVTMNPANGKGVAETEVIVTVTAADAENDIVVVNDGSSDLTPESDGTYKVTLSDKNIELTITVTAASED